MIIARGPYGLAKIGLKIKRGFRCLPRLFAQGNSLLKGVVAVAARINDRQQRPTKRELRVHVHRLSEIFLCGKGIGGCV